MRLRCLGWGGGKHPACPLPPHCPKLTALPSVPLRPQMQEELVLTDRARDPEGHSEEEEGLEGEVERADQAAGRKEAVGERGEEEEEVELELDAEEEARMEEEASRRNACLLDETFEEELMEQLEEFEQVIQQLQFELEVARTRCSLATGRWHRTWRQLGCAGRTGAGPACSSELGAPWGRAGGRRGSRRRWCWSWTPGVAVRALQLMG